jgi:plastocyanin
MKQLLALPVLAVSALALTACSGSDASPATAPADSDVVVRAQAAISFDQKAYSATSHEGRVILTLINDSSQPHNAHVVDGNGDEVDSSTKAPSVSGKGDEATATFSLAPGQYRVVCKVPGHGNMDSKLTVS